MRLFFSDSRAEGSFVLEGDEFRHLQVLRLQAGDELFITCGDGYLHTCRVQSIGKKLAVAEILSSEFQRNPYRNSVFVGQLKHPDRMEWMVEKLTEIGVLEIGFIHTDLSENRKMKLERLNRLAVSAMKQSLKTHLPSIFLLKNIEEALHRAQGKMLLLGHCYDDLERIPLSLVQKKDNPVVMFIGPEGDFSREEVNLALEKGAHAVSLGATRLRTETAAMVALALLNDKP